MTRDEANAASERGHAKAEAIIKEAEELRLGHDCSYAFMAGFLTAQVRMLCQQLELANLNSQKEPT